MSRRSKLAAFCIICLLGSHPLFSQIRTVRFHAGGGVWLPLESTLDAGFQTGFGFSLVVVRHIDLVFDFKFGKMDVLDPEHSLDGEISLSPFWASVRFHLFPHRKGDVYCLLGCGVIFSSIRNRDLVNIPEVNIRQVAKNGGGILAGAGGSYRIAPHFAVFLEATLLHRRTIITTTIDEMYGGRQQEEWPFNISSAAVSAGLRYTY